MKAMTDGTLLALKILVFWMLSPLLLAGGLMWFYDYVKANAPRPAVQAQPTDWRPDIPQCDKPLWERITEGCNED